MNDLENKELMTVSYNEEIKGWTSFHSFVPDWMIGMNNKFYSFKNGNLYNHHSGEVSRNSFYGTVYTSKLSVMVNAAPSDIKELQAISLEGNFPWNTAIKAFVSNVDDFTASSVNQIEYVKKEGIWFAYARRNENPEQVDSKSMYGLGTVIAISGTTLTVRGFNSSITAGDVLLNADLAIVGTIQSSVTIDGFTSIVLNTVNNIALNDFVIGSKNPRIEGGNLRGYTLRFDMEVSQPIKVELFAVNAEIMKSFP